MLCLRHTPPLLLLMAMTAPGQKVEKDGLERDQYNMDMNSGDEPIRKAEDHKEEDMKFVVTEEVYFDVMVHNRTEKELPFSGRIQIACFGEIVPVTCLNFVSLAKGYKQRRATLTYKNTKVHKIIKDFIIQMGDVTGKKGTSGTSIYGPTFRDENFQLSHRGAGWVSMANHGRDTNGSQFFILLQPARWLNGRHVVFGKVIKGMEFIRKLGEVDTYVTGYPMNNIEVQDCGVIELRSRYEIPYSDVTSADDIIS